jgi:acetylornithine deacetylase
VRPDGGAPGAPGVAVGSADLRADLRLAVDRLVAERGDEMVDDLLAAVSHASINPTRAPGGGEGVGEGPFQEFLLGLCRAKGLPAAAQGTGLPGRPNVEVELAGDPGRHSLLLNSHCDVVTADEPGWAHPPFEPRIVDGSVVGRGASDAKGSLMAMLEALWVAREVAGEGLGTVTLTSVVDEEAGGGGTAAWLQRRETVGGALPDAAIVGEPTGLRPAIVTRGARSFHLRVRGRGAHAGEAYEGVNAVRLAMRYVDALEELHQGLAVRADPRLWPGLATPYVFNLGRVQGGDSFGSVAAECEVEGVVGWVPPDTLESMSEEVEKAVDAVTASDAWLAGHPPEWRWGWLAFDAGRTPEGHELVRLLGEEAASRGLPAEPCGLMAGTDMRLLVVRGGIPTVNFGPGDMAQGHSANERLPLDEYLDAIRILAHVILRWCSTPRRGDP